MYAAGLDCCVHFNPTLAVEQDRQIPVHHPALSRGQHYCLCSVVAGTRRPLSSRFGKELEEERNSPHRHSPNTELIRGGALGPGQIPCLKVSNNRERGTEGRREGQKQCWVKTGRLSRQTTEWHCSCGCHLGATSLYWEFFWPPLLCSLTSWSAERSGAVIPQAQCRCRLLGPCHTWTTTTPFSPSRRWVADQQTRTAPCGLGKCGQNQ